MKPHLTFQERLSTGRPLLGFLQTQPSPAVAELAGMCGFDFVILDGEHGVFDQLDYLHAMHALTAADVLCVVRVPGPDTLSLGWYLDLGADAVLVPRVSLVEQARALARAMEYPPAGTRGFAAPMHRSTRYGIDLRRHLNAPRQGTGLILMIESALGASNAAAIASVPGVDALFIGLADLSTDLQCFAEFDNPRYAEAFGLIENAALTNGKHIGTAPHSGYPIESLMGRGHRLLLLASDVGLMREAMLNEVSRAKSIIQPGSVSTTHHSSGSKVE